MPSFGLWRGLGLTRHQPIHIQWPALGPEVAPRARLPGPRPPATKMIPCWTGLPLSPFEAGPSLPEVFRRARGGGFGLFFGFVGSRDLNSGGFGAALKHRQTITQGINPLRRVLYEHFTSSSYIVR